MPNSLPMMDEQGDLASTGGMANNIQTIVFRA